MRGFSEMAIDNELLIRSINIAEESSYGSDSDAELSAARAEAIQYYLGENLNPAPSGRSQVVDRTIFETVEQILPSLVRIFASGDEVCRVVPVGPDDDQAAAQTTALLQWTATQKNNWEQLCHDWFKDALLFGSSYALAHWDRTDRVERETYEGQTDEQLAMLVQDADVRVLQHSERPDEEENARRQQVYQQQVAQYRQLAASMQQPQMQPGQPPPQMPPPPQAPQPAMLHDVVIERVESSGRVALQVLAAEHCKIDMQTPDFTLRHARYFEYWEEKSISDLRSMGLEVPDDIADGEEVDTEEDQARDRFGEDRDGDDFGSRRVRCRMVWIRCAAEDDGVERLYYVIRVGSSILYVEPCSRIPVASIAPLPMPHRHVGMSVYDIGKDLQDTKTAIHRGALDSLYLANSGRFAVSDQVSMEDMLTSRPGGIVRLRPGARPADGHIMPLVHPFIFDQVIGSLSYFDQVKQNRFGVNAYFNGTDAGAMNRTASGVAMLTGQSAQRVEQIARMIAVGVEYLFSVMLELIQKHENRTQTFQMRGKWFAVHPAEWARRRDLKISVGVGAGNKDAMLAQLQAMFAAQLQTIPLGIANPQTLYETAIEIAKLQGFSNPEKFWVDPSQRPPAPPQPPLPLQIEQMKSQADAQVAQVKLQADAQVEAMKMQHEAQLKQAQLEFDRWRVEFEAQTKLQLEAMKMGEQRQIERERLDSAERVKAAEISTSVQAKEAELQRADRDFEANTNGKAQADSAIVGKITEIVAGQRPASIEKVRDKTGRMVGAVIRRADGTTDQIQIH